MAKTGLMAFVGAVLLLAGPAGAPAAQEPPVKESERREPNLTASDVFSGVGEQLKAVTDSQIKILQRLIDVTDDADPEKPDLLFRMAELYAEQERYYNFKARSLDDRISQSEKAGDKEASAKLVAEQKEHEKREKQWLLEAVKKYVEVANGPKYQDYKKMDQVLFYLAYLLTQVKKEDQARVFFKRLIKDYPTSPFLPHAYLSFGMYFFDSKDMENALKFFDKVLQYPDSPVYGFTLYMKGWVYYNLEDYAKAMATFIEVIEGVAARKEKVRGGDAQLAKETCKDLVRVYARIGTPEKAWEFFKKYGRDYAPTMMKQLSELYAELGKAEEAQAARKALEEATKQAEATGARLLAKVDEAHTKAKTLSCDFEVLNQEAGKPDRKLAQSFRVKGKKCLFEFTGPEDMKGTKVLFLSPTEMYVYLPAFGKVRRIASHVKDKGFFGLTFAIEDYFFNTYSDQYSAAVASDSGPEVQLLLTPKPGQEAPYAKIDMTVSKDQGVATLLKCYDQKGALLKTETRSGYDNQDGVLLPSEIRMADNTVEGRSTTMLRKSLKVNEDLPDDLFSKRELEK